MDFEKQQLVQNAALTGHYQIVCRQLFAAINSWYITTLDVENWNWEINEYRIFVGTREPPMTDEMNDYSVYYCGYNYYFIDTNGIVRRVLNVNLTEYGEQYTTFLKCAKIQANSIFSDDTGYVQIKDNMKVHNNLEVIGTATIGKDTTIGGKTTINNDLTVDGPVELGSDLKVDGSLTIGGNFRTTGTFNLEGNVGADKFSAPKITVNEISKYSGEGNISVSTGVNVSSVKSSGNIETNSNIKADGNLSCNNITAKNANLKNITLTGNETIGGNLTVTGTINGLTIKVV